MTADESYTEPKSVLLRYLQTAREVLLWKLEGLSDYDVRRPLVPTGTSLLGTVKHVASVEAGYLGDVFGRPSPESLPWFGPDAQPNADFLVTAEESRDDVIELYRRVWAHSDATVEALPLDAVGVVPWWQEGRQEVRLHQILVHMIAETHRHAGHSDVVRELIDGAVGVRPGNDNMPDEGDEWWTEYRARVQAVADSFR